MWMPDRRSRQPLYQQIADDIERRIAYGEFPLGSLLPSERKLAAQLGVNRSTVILAYAELRALGIIESRSGSGTRVSKYKWGATPKHTPNWHRYVEGGSFLPNVAFLRQLMRMATLPYYIRCFQERMAMSVNTPNSSVASTLWRRLANK